MPRYDAIYEILAKRAIREGGIDVEAFVDLNVQGGVSADRVMELLLDDLENDGPVFGRFFRTLTGAAENSVTAAYRQGSVAADVDLDDEIKRLTGLANMDDIITGADPALLAEVEELSAEHMELTWIAELRNTCHRCLPLHGQSRFKDEWDESGFSPDTIHVVVGWSSPCHCSLVPRKFAEGRDEIKAPLVRNKLKGVTGVKGSKRTARGVSQQDLDKSIAARDKAMDSLEGRRTLRQLGTSNRSVRRTQGPTGTQRVVDS